MSLQADKPGGRTAEAEPPARERRPRAAPKAVPPRRESAATAIRRSLRAEIVAMERKPGEAISEKAIATAFGVSRTPVREALIQLADEGLVDVFPQSGTFVARIPLSGLPEAILVRESLEATMVRLAAERAGADDITALEACLARQRDCAARDDRPNFHREDENFHGLIAAIAGCPGVWTLVQQVKIQIDRFRRLTLPVPGRMQAVIEEHGVIVEAIAARAPERAVELMARHLGTMKTGLAQTRGLYPDYFFDDRGAPQGSPPL